MRKMSVFWSALLAAALFGFGVGAQAQTASSSSSSSASPIMPPPYVTGLVATASNQSGSSRAASRAVDGSGDTRWEASNASVGTWLRVDFARPTQVKWLELIEYGGRIKGYAIQYLAGSDWVTAHNGDTIGGVVLSLNLPATTAVRLLVTARPSGQPSISEFKVRGFESTSVVQVSSSIVVAAGQTFDGGSKTYMAAGSLLSTGVVTGRPMFVLEEGANLSNVVIALPAVAETLVQAKGGNTLSGITWLSTGYIGLPLRVTGSKPVVVKSSSVLGTPDQAVRIADGANLSLINFKVVRSAGVVRHTNAFSAVRVSIQNSDLRDSAYIVQTLSQNSGVFMTNSYYCNIAQPLFVLAPGVVATQANNTSCAI